MTAQDRSTNKSRFQQGDTPQGSDFADLIDSFTSLVDASPTQTVASDLRAANFITSGKVSAAVISAPTFNLTNINATNITATRESPSDLHVTTSARMVGTLNVVGVATLATVSSTMLFPGTVRMPGAAISANMVVFATAQNPVTAAGVGQGGKMMCRGLVAFTIDGTVAYVPFFYST